MEITSRRQSAQIYVGYRVHPMHILSFYAVTFVVVCSVSEAFCAASNILVRVIFASKYVNKTIIVTIKLMINLAGLIFNQLVINKYSFI